MILPRDLQMMKMTINHKVQKLNNILMINQMMILKNKEH